MSTMLVPARITAMELPRDASRRILAGAPAAYFRETPRFVAARRMRGAAARVSPAARRGNRSSESKRPSKG